ncbi:TPA: hypothetical protein JDD40_003644 [Salmonella enterica subsp. diarizonae]|nr:hypothetical protein [Salmonella enterica]EDY1994423.1 hypothetical protein [Salmonella enterica subsp. diarizonae]EIO8740652.1 hypothetical protein [Salmonella enterica]HAU3137518.1 hypothetical protein [Salmonella enterica subsp. diarizonae]
MLQMKFKPRFIEAFRSGQKITSLRMMDFRCRCYNGHDYPPVYIHSDTLKYRTHVDTAEVFDLSLPAGLAVKYTSDLAELLAFMRNIYPTKDPLSEMFWLYTFTNIQMLPMQGGAA